LGLNHEAPVAEIERAADLSAHNLLVSFGYVLALTARDRDGISVLDWGGGIGHYYALGRALLRGVEIEYTSRDLPLLSARGRELLPRRARTRVRASSSLPTARARERLRALLPPPGARRPPLPARAARQVRGLEPRRGVVACEPARADVHLQPRRQTFELHSLR